MTDRPILRLPNPRPQRRITGSPANPPRPTGVGSQNQSARFRAEFSRLEKAFSGDNPSVVLRQDPFGVAPERALVFVTAVPVANFLKVATDAGIEVFGEFDASDDFEIPAGLLSDDHDAVAPTFYATMPTIEGLRRLLRMWRKYKKGESAPHGAAPWWNLFEMLAELRPWGPEDRLSRNVAEAILARLPLDDDAEIKLELEIWPSSNDNKRSEWASVVTANVVENGGRVVARSSIREVGFIYEALLVGLPAFYVRGLIEQPASDGSLALLDGVQFIQPQVIAQCLPESSDVIDADASLSGDPFDENSPFRVLLLDGTPVAAHPSLSGGVAIEDVNEIVPLSRVPDRKHATSMASLILRGDLESDNVPLPDSRLLSIPVLVDTAQSAISPNEQLFIDIVHASLARAFAGDEPLAPDAFVVNFSIGIVDSHFSGRISALARLLDWWSSTYGVLFVVAAGNVSELLHIPGLTSINFENLSTAERKIAVIDALKSNGHTRGILSPAEAMNVISVGAACEDFIEESFPAPAGELLIRDPANPSPAISSAIGPGADRSIKPDLLMTGGSHWVRPMSQNGGVSLRILNTIRTGLFTASAGVGAGARVRTRGTSCAAALVTRAHVFAAAALTAVDGPFEGQELPRQDLALLTRALSINSARWSDEAFELYDKERSNGLHHSVAKAEVTKHFGHGFLQDARMREAPALGATLVGLGTLRKDGALIFDLPLPPSLAGQKIGRSMLVTLTWFSPMDGTRARYRLAALEALSAEDENEDDKDWYLSLKSDQLDNNMIKRGTVWSKRMTAKNKTVPRYADNQTIPIRVQCRDSSGGGLSPDDDIRFALAITLELEATVQFDIHQEISDRLRVQVRGRS